MRAIRSVAVLAAALTVGSALTASPHRSAGAAHSPAAPAPSMRLVSSTPPVLFGLGDPDWDTLGYTESKLGVDAGVVGTFRKWATASDFPTSYAAKARSMHAVPMFAWIATSKNNTIDDPSYSLRAIANGRHDTYIRRWAREAASYGHPVLMRLFPEMNLPGHPYSIGVNGNTNSDFIAAWRHVVQIFRNHNATNVKWVWNPDRYFSGGRQFKPMWPGGSWVDWVGIDAYNFGTSGHGGWISFKNLVSPSITQIDGFAPNKPLMLPELGCSEYGGSKATWLTNMFQSAQAMGFRIMVWFDHKRPTVDWRFASSSSSMSAARSGVRLTSWVWPGRISLLRIERYVTTGSPS